MCSSLAVRGVWKGGVGWVGFVVRVRGERLDMKAYPVSHSFVEIRRRITYKSHLYF